MDTNLLIEKLESNSNRKGNHSSLYANTYCNSVAKTNAGTETLKTTIAEMAWSTIVFFLSAAAIPHANPMGMVKHSEKTFSIRVSGILSRMIANTGRLGYRVIDSPKSKERKFLIKIAYCSPSGLSR